MHGTFLSWLPLCWEVKSFLSPLLIITLTVTVNPNAKLVLLVTSFAFEVVAVHGGGLSEGTFGRGMTGAQTVVCMHGGRRRHLLIC